MPLEDKLDALDARIRELIVALQALEHRIAIGSISVTPPDRQAVNAHLGPRTLVTITEAAGILSCSPASVRAWMQRRQLPRVKVGRLVRLRREDVEHVMERGLPARSGVAVDGRRVGRRRVR